MYINDSNNGLPLRGVPYSPINDYWKQTTQSTQPTTLLKSKNVIITIENVEVSKEFLQELMEITAMQNASLSLKGITFKEEGKVKECVEKSQPVKGETKQSESIRNYELSVSISRLKKENEDLREELKRSRMYDNSTGEETKAWGWDIPKQISGKAIPNNEVPYVENIHEECEDPLDNIFNNTQEFEPQEKEIITELQNKLQEEYKTK